MLEKKEKIKTGESPSAKKKGKIIIFILLAIFGLTFIVVAIFMFAMTRDPAHAAMMGSHFSKMRSSFGMTNKSIENEDEVAALFEKSPVELGRRLYASYGCNACHTLDGALSVGPSFLGLFGKNRVFKDGTSAKADEDYMAKSIRYSKDRIVLGYNRSMPSFDYLSDKEVTALTEYIKTIK